MYVCVYIYMHIVGTGTTLVVAVAYTAGVIGLVAIGYAIATCVCTRVFARYLCVLLQMCLF